MDKRKLKIALKICISILFIGYISFKVDFSVIVGAFRRINFSLYLLSTLIALFSNFIIAGKYYFLIRESPITHTFLSLVRINFITRFYALFLPSAVGREAVRWFKVTRNQDGRVLFLSSIIFERLTFLFVLILCAAVPLFFYNSMPEITVLRTRLMPWIFISIGIIFLSLSFYFFAPLRLLVESLTRRISASILQKFDVNSFLKNFSLQNIKTPSCAIIFGLSLIWQLFFLSRLSALMAAASLPLTLVDVAWMGSLVLLLQTLPISFAGIGLREGAYAYLFSLYKLPPEKGILIGVLFFSQMLIMASIGGIFEFLDR